MEFVWFVVFWFCIGGVVFDLAVEVGVGLWVRFGIV